MMQNLHKFWSQLLQKCVAGFSQLWHIIIQSFRALEMSTLDKTISDSDSDSLSDSDNLNERKCKKL